MKLNRRDFLKFTGGAAIGTALSGVTVKGLNAFTRMMGEEGRPPSGVEEWVPSVCQQCPGGCGILVRVVGGRAVKIEGNPLYPVNRGTLCPKGQAGLQVLYNPDRIKGPLRRAGERGSGQWEPIKWEEAIETVAERLYEMRAGEEAHTLAFIGGQERGLMRMLVNRFLEVYGSPNYISTPAGFEAAEVALYLTQGIRGPIGYDLENANYILSFGGDLLEGWGSPVWMMRNYGSWRQGRPGGRAKIIQVDTRLSVTAAKADEWIPINPGTYGALALGIAYVILFERLYDEKFVAQYTFGFEDWTDAQGNGHIGFKSLVLREYPLNVVAKITGVSVETILRLGREFASTKPAIALGSRGGDMYANMAIHSLNALVGSIDAPGGVVVQREVPYTPWPPVNKDSLSKKGLSMPRIDGVGASGGIHNLPEAITLERPYRINAVLIYNANPLFSSPQSTGFYEALDKVPLIVSFSPFMDETAEYADLVLPEHTYLERWQDDPTPPGLNSTLYGIRQPAVSPLYDTRHTGDVIIALARKMGFAQDFPWNDFKEVLRGSVRGLYDAQRGHIVGTHAEEAWAQLLERVGWWDPSYHSVEELWDQMVEEGGWWDPYYYFGEWDRVFQTPSRRFEFYSQKLKGDLALREGAAGARGEEAFMPHYEPVGFVGDEEEYPLCLNPYRLLALAGGEGANQPFLQEILGPHTQDQWDSWAEVNPSTAEALGISEGEWIWVESPVGRIKVRARLYPGAMPSVVNVPVGLGHQASGRWAKGRGVNPNRIVARTHNPLSQLVRVKIYKAS